MSPVFRSIHTADKRLPSSVALVAQTCSSQTTGEDQALPGSAVFQRMFCVSLHWIGKPVASEMPAPSGPRNCVQRSAAEASGLKQIKARQNGKTRMRSPALFLAKSKNSSSGGLGRF